MADRDWSELPNEILANIAEKVDTNVDLVLFRSVCQSWRSSAPRNSNVLPPLIPNFYIAEGEEVCRPHEDFNLDDYDLYLNDGGIHDVVRDLVQNTVYALQPLDQSHCIRSPSSKLWLIKVEDKGANVLKFRNVLTGSRLKFLPGNFPRMLNTLDFKSFCVCKEILFLSGERDDPYPSGRQALYLLFPNTKPKIMSPMNEDMFEVQNRDSCIVKKVLVCSTATKGGFLVIAIHRHGRLVLFKSGDELWTVMPGEKGPFHDLIHHKGRFYVVESTGRTFIVDPYTSEFVLVSSCIEKGGRKKRFVESNEQLFLVDMYIDFGPEFADWDEAHVPAYYYKSKGKPTPWRFDAQAMPNGCKVFKLCEHRHQWIRADSFGDCVFFLGEGSSFSIPMSSLCHGFSGNYIVFSDEYYIHKKGEESADDPLSRGIRVFNLKDDSFGELKDYPVLSDLFWPPPNWVSPM